MRSSIVLFLFSFFSTQVMAQSFVNLQGQIKNSTHTDIIISYSSSWLDPLTTSRTCTIDGSGNFSIQLQFEEKIKPANIIYGTDTIELILTGGEGLIMTADGKDFLKTIHFEGTGGPNANFCVKHGIQRGRMMQHTQKIISFFNKNIPAFRKALDNDYKAEMKYLAANGIETTPILKRYWRISYEYDKYCNMFQYPSLHHPDAKNSVVHKQAPNNKHPYNIIDSIPEIYKDELLLMPQYRQYVMFEADKHNDPHLYPEHREAQLNKFLYTTLPPQTGEYAAASMVFSLIGKDDKLANEKLQVFKSHFTRSKYVPIIEVKLPQ